MLTLPDFKQKQIIIILLNKGEKVSFKNDNLIVVDGNGKTKLQTTCYRIFALFLVGGLTITSGLLERSKRFNFSIIFMTNSLRVYGVWSNGVEGNTYLKIKQYNYDSLGIAGHIVENKISNQIELLDRIRKKDLTLKKTIIDLREYKSRLIKNGIDLKDMLGIEGICAKLYFSKIFSECNWKARRPRVKEDSLNCLLDIGYTFLFSFIEALLSCYGFDLYKGVYHREFYNRKSLVCDLMEPFRCIIDFKIRKMFNLKQIKNEDFTIIQGRYNLFGGSASPYLSLIMEAIFERKEEIFLYIQQYYRCFMKESKIENYPKFTI